MKTIEEVSYKHWIRCCLSLSCVIFVLIVLFNYLCCMRQEKTAQIVLEQAAQNVLAGNSIAGLGDDKAYDDRLLQKCFIQQMQKLPDVIVLGSSRSMMIRKKHVSSDSSIFFFNHFLASGSFEDSIAIIGMYESLQKKLPKTIIFGIDPWIFNKISFSFKWKSIGNYYQKILKSLPQPCDMSKESIKKDYDYMRLVTLKYTLENIKTRGQSPLSFFIPDSYNIDEFIRDSDGSVHVPYKIKIQDDQVTQKIVQDVLADPEHQCTREQFTTLAHTTLFENFITYLQKNGCHVTFFLPPYHPDLFNFLSTHKEYKSVVNVENYLKDFAQKNTIKIIGSYNPVSYNLTNQDFFDGIHGHEKLIDKVFHSR